MRSKVRTRNYISIHRTVTCCHGSPQESHIPQPCRIRWSLPTSCTHRWALLTLLLGLSLPLPYEEYGIGSKPFEGPQEMEHFMFFRFMSFRLAQGRNRKLTGRCICLLFATANPVNYLKRPPFLEPQFGPTSSSSICARSASLVWIKLFLWPAMSWATAAWTEGDLNARGTPVGHHEGCKTFDVSYLRRC